MQRPWSITTNKLDESNNDQRCDRFGNIIVPGAKDHRIWFKDEIGEGPVEQINEVEWYKYYYKEQSFITWNWIII